MDFLRRHIFIILTLLLLLVGLLSLSKPGDDSSLFRKISLTVAEPIYAFVTYTTRGISDLWDDYSDLLEARHQLHDLQSIHQQQSLVMQEMKGVEEENGRLRQLLGFSRRYPMSYAPANVIAADLSTANKSVIINLGRKDGVAGGSVVVDAHGIIGRVIEVHPGLSRVLLMIDPNSSIDGLVKRTSARGMVQGISDRNEFRCRFAFSLKQEEIEIGDEVVTSGLDHVFPPDFPLGIVTEIRRDEHGLFQEAIIRPASDVENLREVLLIKGPAKTP